MDVSPITPFQMQSAEEVWVEQQIGYLRTGNRDGVFGDDQAEFLADYIEDLQIQYALFKFIETHKPEIKYMPASRSWSVRMPNGVGYHDFSLWEALREAESREVS